MANVNLGRKRAKLKRAIGIRARFALLLVILVAPLLLERVYSLETARAKQIADATAEYATLAGNSADAQRALIFSVETILRSESFLHATSGGVNPAGDLLPTGQAAGLPWIRSLLITGQNGRVQCSTNDADIGADLSNQPYFREAQRTGHFTLSDALLSPLAQTPSVMAIYPGSTTRSGSGATVLAVVNLDQMSKVMENLGGRPGISAVLVDSLGTVVAAPADQRSEVGRPLSNAQLPSAIADVVLHSHQDKRSLSFTAADGSKHAVSSIRIANTRLRLISNIDEVAVSAAIDRDIRSTYLRLGFICLFVVLCTLLAREKLVITPIATLTDMARRFSEGDLSARAARDHLPADFLPLARAFNVIAFQLSRRARELIANNDRLMVMASIDVLSGLANRRNFQTRLDFEWARAQQYGGELSLLMIDVDHFKLYNDTYGHLEGDACLTKIGETLSGIAAQSTGFAARYGGEEFCLLLPNTGLQSAIELGEKVRSAVQRLRLPHPASNHMTVTVSIGIATARPNNSLHSIELIEAADAALYAAKHLGRNTVVEHGLLRVNQEVAGMAVMG